MIVKQNCYVLTDNELDAIETGTYYAPQRIEGKEGKLQMQASPVTYTGSSIQRRNYKSVPQKKKQNPEILEHSLSPRSKTKIKQKMIAWAQCKRKKSLQFTFMTLTLTSPQIGTDKDYTRMLNTFFTYMRKYTGLKNYLYVLEKTQKKNIHCHVILDAWQPIERLNREWCRVLGKYGYSFPSRNYETGHVQTVTPAEALKLYYGSGKYAGSETYRNLTTGQQFTPTRNVNKPNPLDLKFIYNIKAVSQYVTKYITKSISKLNTSVWNCSTSISKLWTGAKVNALEHLLPLREHVACVIRQTLDIGHVLNIHLLRHYTHIQQKLFSDINLQYL